MSSKLVVPDAAQEASSSVTNNPISPDSYICSLRQLIKGCLDCLDNLDDLGIIQDLANLASLLVPHQQPLGGS